MEESSDLQTELDSHDNVVVLGSNSFFFESTDRTSNARPFTSDLGTAKNVMIVGGNLACHYPYSGEVYVLVIRNALHVPSMDHKLIPPFIMRYGGVTTNNFPKIHCEDPIVSDYGVSFEHSNL